MRATQSELLKVVNSDVKMHLTESGFFNRAVTVAAVMCALTRLQGRAHWLDVAYVAAEILQLHNRVVRERCTDEPNRTKWERECSLAYSDILVRQGVCLPWETTTKGIWQFAANIAPETPDYSKLKDEN